MFGKAARAPSVREYFVLLFQQFYCKGNHLFSARCRIFSLKLQISHVVEFGKFKWSVMFPEKCMNSPSRLVWNSTSPKFHALSFIDCDFRYCYCYCWWCRKWRRWQCLVKYGIIVRFHLKIFNLTCTVKMTNDRSFLSWVLFFHKQILYLYNLNWYE